MQALKALIPALDRGLETGLNKLYDYPGESGWTPDKVIQVLLAREERKRERSQRARYGRQVREQAVRSKIDEAAWDDSEHSLGE